MKLSVIIPAYNCELLIGDTIQSVLTQCLTDIEIIIANDGSTDNTLDVVTKFAKADSRIKVITLKNGGPAKARNEAIKLAKGEYLYFMDSDDLIDEDMLLSMYNLAKEHDLDEVVCGYRMVNISHGKTGITEFSHEAFIARTSQEFHSKLMGLLKAHVMYVVWNKLFRASMLKDNGLFFESGFMSGEDRLFNFNMLLYVNRFGFIDRPFYRYFIRGQHTLANRYVDNRFESALLAHKQLIKVYKERGGYDDKTSADVDFIFIKTVLACFTQLNAKGCKLTYKEKKAYIEEILQNDCVKSAVNNHSVTGVYAKAVNAVLRFGNLNLIYLMSKAIFIIQFKLNSFFLALKHSKKGR